MSKCWRCNKEFYNPYGNNTLCDECLGRQPKITTIDGWSKRIFKEKLIPSHCLEQYEKYEKQLEEKDKLIKDLQLDNQKLFDKWATSEYVNQNQKAIEELEKIYNLFNGTQILLYVENRIAELKGEK